MAKTYVVVGGGLLGAHTACLLAARGDDVTVFSRSFNGWLRTQRAEGAAVRFAEGTLPPEEPLVEVIAATEPEAVFSFVGFSTPARSAQSALASTSDWLLPAQSVLEAAARCAVPRTILSSSGGTIYGTPDLLPTPESYPLAPISVHGSTSQAIEGYAGLYRDTRQLETVVLRYSNVYGPGERVRGEQGVIAAWCEAIAFGEPVVMIGDPATRRDFLFAADAAEAAVGALDVEPGVYNVGTGEGVELAALLELIKEVTGEEPRVERRPGRGVDVPATALDSTRFRSATGWRPDTSLVDGIAAMWRWITSAPASARVT